MFLSLFFFFKQKTAYEMRISDWSSDVCSSDLLAEDGRVDAGGASLQQPAAVVGLQLGHRLAHRRLRNAGSLRRAANVPFLNRQTESPQMAKIRALHFVNLVLP